MKTFASVLLLAAFVAAEPPVYRQQFQQFRFQRQELESGQDSTTSRGDDAPYAAAGFKPSKEFNLPSRQEVSPPSTSYGVPDDSYGAPLRTYIAPQTTYGAPEKAPENEYGVPEQGDEGKDEVAEDDAENLKVEGVKAKLEEGPKNDAEVVNAQGVYYILLPNSQLQRVQFQTENDIRNMAYTARLQYKNEDRAPVFVYTAVPQYQSQAYVQLW